MLNIYVCKSFPTIFRVALYIYKKRKKKQIAEIFLINKIGNSKRQSSKNNNNNNNKYNTKLHVVSNNFQANPNLFIFIYIHYIL